MPYQQNALVPILLIALNTIAALVGILFPEVYREPAVSLNAMSKATFFANDLLTLLIAIPMMTTAWLIARNRPSPRAHLLWLGGIFYTVYNQSFYIFCVELNILYPIFLSAFTIGLTYLVVEILHLDTRMIGEKLETSAFTRRACAIHATAFSLLLITVWSIEWFSQIHATNFDPIASSCFKNIAALDVTLLVPGLLFTASRLWRKDPWGIATGIILNVGIGLYMAVLAFGELKKVHRGLHAAIDNVPMWVILSILSLASVALLLSHSPRKT